MAEQRNRRMGNRCNLRIRGFPSQSVEDLLRTVSFSFTSLPSRFSGLHRSSGRIRLSETAKHTLHHYGTGTAVLLFSRNRLAASQITGTALFLVNRYYARPYTQGSITDACALRGCIAATWHPEGTRSTSLLSIWQMTRRSSLRLLIRSGDRRKLGQEFRTGTSRLGQRRPENAVPR